MVKFDVPNLSTWLVRVVAHSCEIMPYYTVSQKSPPFYFSNNSVKN